MSRTPADVLADFGLTDVNRLPAHMLTQRILKLAEFAAAYDASFNRLSELLRSTRRKLATAETREADAQRLAERAWIALAQQAHVMRSLEEWYHAAETPYRPLLEQALIMTVAAYVEKKTDE